MTTLQGQKIVVIGGSSGIGYALTKAVLLASADHVTIASSSQSKVDNAVQELLAEAALKLREDLGRRIVGKVLDLRETQNIRNFFEEIGELDHLVITAGTRGGMGGEFKTKDVDKLKGGFDERFWGPVVAAQSAKIRPGGSITFTTGLGIFKPRSQMALLAGVGGSVEALTRGLAIDLAPVRVNSVAPGIVDTPLWDLLAQNEKEKAFTERANELPVKHIGRPEQIAEAYLFLMKCDFITGQSILVDGGAMLV